MPTLFPLSWVSLISMIILPLFPSLNTSSEYRPIDYSILSPSSYVNHSIPSSFLIFSDLGSRFFIWFKCHSSHWRCFSLLRSQTHRRRNLRSTGDNSFSLFILINNLQLTSSPSNGNYSLTVTVVDTTHPEFPSHSIDVAIVVQRGKARFRKELYERTVAADKIASGSSLLHISIIYWS